MIDGERGQIQCPDDNRLVRAVVENSVWFLQRATRELILRFSNEPFRLFYCQMKDSPAKIHCIQV